MILKEQTEDGRDWSMCYTSPKAEAGDLIRVPGEILIFYYGLKDFI
jgi:hypothetical protein